MSREERYGTRDLAFSKWHRFIPDDNLKWIDLDYVAFCHRCLQPIAVMEIARDVGQQRKPYTVTRNVALSLNVPGARVFYKVNEQGQVIRFRVKRIAPDIGNDREVSPLEFTAILKRLRTRHTCAERRAA